MNANLFYMMSKSLFSIVFSALLLLNPTTYRPIVAYGPPESIEISADADFDIDSSVKVNKKVKQVAVIRFSGEINSRFTKKILESMKTANSMNVDRIVLEIDSPGGSVSEGFAIIDAIEHSRAPISCVVVGDAASMAFVVLQSCDTRLMTYQARLMIHQPFVHLSEEVFHINDLVSLLSRLEAIEKAMVSYCSERMGMTFQEFMDRINGRDWWFSSTDAKKFHAVDGVVNSVDDLF